MTVAQPVIAAGTYESKSIRGKSRVWGRATSCICTRHSTWVVDCEPSSDLELGGRTHGPLSRSIRSMGRRRSHRILVRQRWYLRLPDHVHTHCRVCRTGRGTRCTDQIRTDQLARKCATCAGHTIEPLTATAWTLACARHRDKTPYLTRHGSSRPQWHRSSHTRESHRMALRCKRATGAWCSWAPGPWCPLGHIVRAPTRAGAGKTLGGRSRRPGACRISNRAGLAVSEAGTYPNSHCNHAPIEDAEPNFGC